MKLMSHANVPSHRSLHKIPAKLKNFNIYFSICTEEGRGTGPHNYKYLLIVMGYNFLLLYSKLIYYIQSNTAAEVGGCK